jgi:hypothetical protein
VETPFLTWRENNFISLERQPDHDDATRTRMPPMWRRTQLANFLEGYTISFGIAGETPSMVVLKWGVKAQFAACAFGQSVIGVTQRLMSKCNAESESWKTRFSDVSPGTVCQSDRLGSYGTSFGSDWRFAVRCVRHWQSRR